MKNQKLIDAAKVLRSKSVRDFYIYDRAQGAFFDAFIEAEEAKESTPEPAKEPKRAPGCNCGADGWNRSGTAPEHRQVPHALNCAVQTMPAKPEPKCWRCGWDKNNSRHVNSTRLVCTYSPERRIATSDRRKGPGEDAGKLALDVLEKWKDGGWNARIQLRTVLRAEDNVFGRFRIRRACDRKEKA